MIVDEISPPPLTQEEKQIFSEIETGGAGYYKPRPIKRTRFEGTPDSWQGIYADECQYDGWLEFNRLNRIDDDEILKQVLNITGCARVFGVSRDTIATRVYRRKMPVLMALATQDTESEFGMTQTMLKR